ncbi:prohead protease/major capsid protein fusion protein [Sansalvadorimonas verongulae]|uniref:prohead protease/major capsid protein fusion protein n=1 Tax=Sansalvadorimonas verongulae TaxID=2172824 RepID=UPI0012BD61FF|nr:prohead protease/major capsid protein fusion protein [Sansalvadorimonas verongulae]MTI13357.1 peptidase U37 [Sansalvadorimonas verongulae]
MDENNVTTRTQTRNIPPMMLQARIMPETWSEEERTVEVVWSTGARVRRYNWWKDEEFNEELSMDPDHIRLGRFNNNAPVCDTHSTYRLGDVIGKVEPGTATTDGTEGRCRVRLSNRDDIAGIVQDIRDGILCNVSVGYRIYKFEDVSEDDDKIKTLRAIDWEPHELSFVPVPADDGAGTRSQETENDNPCEFIFRALPITPEEENRMDENEKSNEGQRSDNGQTPAPQQPSPDAVRQAADEAVKAERQRVSDIRQAVRSAKLGDEFADEMITNGTGIEEARKLIIDKFADQGDNHEARGFITFSSAPNMDAVRSGIENALSHRVNPGKEKLVESGQDFVGLRLLDMAREVVEMNGIRTRGMKPLDIAKRALGTSDFKLILANVTNKTLQAAYTGSPQTFRPIVRQVSLSDFKAVQRTRLGDAPDLQKVNENGEFKYGKFGDEAESYKLETYGRIIPITRQAIVNDDLDAFMRLATMYGRAAADLESDLVWGLFTQNIVMSDNNALFHAKHNNFNSTTAEISVASIGAGRAAMRKQKGVDGRLVSVLPEYLIVPSSLETKAEQFVSTNLAATRNEDINPFAGRLQVLAEPRLEENGGNAKDWFLGCGPAQIDTIELAYLSGDEGLTLEEEEGFDVDGIKFKARLDVAAAPIDWRGLYKQKG